MCVSSSQSFLSRSGATDAARIQRRGARGASDPPPRELGCDRRDGSVREARPRGDPNPFVFHCDMRTRPLTDPVDPGTGRPPHGTFRGATVPLVDAKKEIREFLTTRRARITPEQAGLPHFGSRRRVPGLRREEVALLAGVSADYYTRLERGNTAGVSEQVLDAIARALQLDEPERAHLFDLARARQTTHRPRRRPGVQRVRPGVQRMLDALTVAPAFVRNGRMDILGVNRLGSTLYSEMFANPRRPTNSARFTFLDPRAKTRWQQRLQGEDRRHDWPVAVLRSEAGQDPTTPISRT